MTRYSNPPGSKTFVLVHGANHGGWCFGRVADLLRALGHRVFTPTLSGLAERSGEAMRPINLTSHIDDILKLFHWEELEDVFLCGHSYGGMVVSGVADRIPQRIRNLIYLDAVVPDTGKCMADYVFAGEALLPIMQVVGATGGGLMLPAPPAAFFNVNGTDRALVDRLMTPHPMASLIEPITIGDNTDSIRNHTYIHAKNWGFPPITEQYERAKARKDWLVFEIDAGHDIMLDAPADLAAILNGLN